MNGYGSCGVAGDRNTLFLPPASVPTLEGGAVAYFHVWAVVNGS